MVDKNVAPVRMQTGIKNQIESLIHNLLWNLAASQGKSTMHYEDLLGRGPHEAEGFVKMVEDNPIGRLREALQLYEEQFIHRDDGGVPPVSDALDRIIKAVNQLDTSDGNFTWLDSIQCEIAGAWEQAAFVTGNQQLAQANGFDTTIWYD